MSTDQETHANTAEGVEQEYKQVMALARLEDETVHYIRRLAVLWCSTVHFRQSCKTGKIQNPGSYQF